MSEKIAIVGTKDSILGFKALGLECYPIEKPHEAPQIIKRLMLENQAYAVIYLTDDIASQIQKELDDIKKRSPLLPILIIIPSHKGSLNLETVKIRKMVEKALGTDIFKEKKK